MNKRFISMIMALALVLSVLQGTALAAAKQMEDGVPIWTEATVKDYMRKFVKGEDLEILRGYYDLQIRRYMPLVSYASILPNLQWMTGGFVGFGTYSSFEEPEHKTKTHVLHLCMEKQDLDLYFTHKNKEDDWEVMALEFVFADKQPVSDLAAQSEDSGPEYVEQEIVIGDAPHELKGIHTLPVDASVVVPVPACVLVQDAGGLDRDASIGQTKFFADLAHAFAERGIASVRYDTRAYTYGGTAPQGDEGVAEMAEDAIAAAKFLQAQEQVNGKRIVLVGHGAGATYAPKIASEAGGAFCAMMLIAGKPKANLDGYDVLKTIKKVKLPTYVVQGANDFEVPVGEGVDAYEDNMDPKVNFVDYKVHRGLNHLLMKHEGALDDRGTAREYDTPATLDIMAARDLAAWITGLWSNER